MEKNMKILFLSGFVLLQAFTGTFAVESGRFKNNKDEGPNEKIPSVLQQVYNRNEKAHLSVVKVLKCENDNYHNYQFMHPYIEAAPDNEQDPAYNDYSKQYGGKFTKFSTIKGFPKSATAIKNVLVQQDVAHCDGGAKKESANLVIDCARWCKIPISLRQTVEATTSSTTQSITLRFICDKGNEPKVTLFQNDPKKQKVETYVYYIGDDANDSTKKLDRPPSRYNAGNLESEDWPLKEKVPDTKPEGFAINPRVPARKPEMPARTLVAAQRTPVGPQRFPVGPQRFPVGLPKPPAEEERKHDVSEEEPEFIAPNTRFSPQKPVVPLRNAMDARPSTVGPMRLPEVYYQNPDDTLEETDEPEGDEEDPDEEPTEPPSVLQTMQNIQIDGRVSYEKVIKCLHEDNLSQELKDIRSGNLGKLSVRERMTEYFRPESYERRELKHSIGARSNNPILRQTIQQCRKTLTQTAKLVLDCADWCHQPISVSQTVRASNTKITQVAQIFLVCPGGVTPTVSLNQSKEHSPNASMTFQAFVLYRK